MRRGWKGLLDAGLGDAKTRVLGVLLILLAILGTLATRAFANIETVFVASLLAGSLLGRWWTVLVPMAALSVLQPLEWGANGGRFALDAIAGISFFVVSGYVFVGVLGRRMRPKVLLRVKSVALLTTISVPLTIAYDLWTASGEWYFLTRPFGQSFVQMLEAQVPFTIYHLLSSLIFVPLFGSAFTFLQHHLAAAPAPEEAAREADAG
ncbi:MAG TPA: DUF6580 family putative transport protein [Thermoplasmata archaeon]|jgi:hypothetical protein|nr:DUF6580 family putative transport protein [Thermoplasmata archaeon]